MMNTPQHANYICVCLSDCLSPEIVDRVQTALRHPFYGGMQVKIRALDDPALDFKISTRGHLLPGDEANYTSAVAKVLAKAKG